MQLELSSAVALLNNWEHFDPESTRAQKLLRAFADHPQDDTLRREAENLLLALPKPVQYRLRELASAGS